MLRQGVLVRLGDCARSHASCVPTVGLTGGVPVLTEREAERIISTAACPCEACRGTAWAAWWLERPFLGSG